MYKRMLLLLLALVAGILVLYGCSDDDSNNNRVVITDNQLDSAFAVLMQNTRGMIGSVMNDGYLSGYEFAGLHAIFTGYLADHPGHSKASLGAAMTSLLVMTSDDEVGPYLDSMLDMGRGLLEGLDLGMPAKLTDRERVCLLPADVPSIGIERDFLSKSYLAVVSRAMAMPVQFSRIQNAIRQYGLPAVNNSLAYVNNVLADTDYVCLVTPEMLNVPGMTDTLEIDRTDFLAWAAGVSVVKSFLHLAVAYDIDISGWDSTGIAEILDQDGDWMSLYADGATQMTSARTAFLNGVGLADECLTSLEAEYVTDLDQTNDILGGVFFDNVLTADHIAGYRSYLDLAQAFMTDTVWIRWDKVGGVYHDSVQLNVGAIFSDPIEVPASFAPPYDLTITSVWDTTWDSSVVPPVVDEIDSYYNLRFTWAADSVADWHFPDPTFNGVLVGVNSDTAVIRIFDIDTVDWDGWDTINVPMAPTLEWFRDFADDRGFWPLDN